MALCALAGAAGNVARAAWWQVDDSATYYGFCAPPELRARDLLRFAPGYCRIELPYRQWRPLAVTLWLNPLDPLPATAQVLGSATQRAVRISIDDVPVGTRFGGDGTFRPDTFTVTSAPKPQAPIVIELRVAQPPIVVDPLAGPVVAWPEVGRVDVAPRFTPRAVAMPAIIGALIGIAAVLLVPGQRTRASDVREPAAADWRGAAIVLAALVGYFGLWALVRPPYQTPDEVQHHLRATAVLRDPWFSRRPGEWSLDPRFMNPLARWAPPALDKLFFNTNQRLTHDDLRGLKRVEWLAAEARPAPEMYERAIASYPTLYYLALFAVAQPLTQVLHLSPYDSTFIWRGVSAALAALVWVQVFITLERLPATRAYAGVILALLVLNPMTGFMSSAINIDAVNIPLAVLASLLFWDTLATGARPWWTLAALLATASTKPSGLPLFGGLLASSVGLWLLGHVSVDRLKLAALTLARATLIAWVGFYAWSPTRLLGGPPSQDTIGTYLAHRLATAPETWVTYWGKLGWLEYSAPPFWYVLVLVAVLVGIVCAIWRPGESVSGAPAFALFAALMLVAFVGVTLVGEVVYLPLAGYALQGRHLLPASLGLAGLVMHRVKAARLGFIALLVVLNVVLVQATVDRYYNGQWRLAAYALPFTR